jgi:hypothetical protein
MADSDDPGQVFLKAFTQYVDFRLTEKKVPPSPAQDLQPRLVRFVEKFDLFLKSRHGNPESAAYRDLMAKMAAMKEARGGVGVPPSA